MHEIVAKLFSAASAKLSYEIARIRIQLILVHMIVRDERITYRIDCSVDDMIVFVQTFAFHGPYIVHVEQWQVYGTRYKIERWDLKVFLSLVWKNKLYLDSMSNTVENSRVVVRTTLLIICTTIIEKHRFFVTPPQKKNNLSFYLDKFDIFF